MRVRLFGAALAIGAIALPANAAGLCNCCGASTAQSCATACAEVKPPAGQCQATVDYAATAEIGPGVNPLYGISLRNMNLGKPNRAELEALRNLLEKSRRSAEKDRLDDWHDYDRGKLDAAGLANTRKRYDAAMVNYFLGMSAYRGARIDP